VSFYQGCGADRVSHHVFLRIDNIDYPTLSFFLLAYSASPTYPDILLIKGSPIFQENRTNTVINPSIIIEVLSRSTSNRDRGDKFTFYRSLPHL